MSANGIDGIIFFSIIDVLIARVIHVFNMAFNDLGYIVLFFDIFFLYPETFTVIEESF